MGNKTRNILKAAISLSLAGVLLYFCFREVKWEEFWECLRSTSWGWVGLSMLAGLAAMYFRGLRWRELILPIDPSMKRIDVYDANTIGTLVNLVLPRVGEVVRCGYVTVNSERDSSGRHKASVDKVMGTAIVDRFWDLLLMLICIFVVAVVLIGRYGDFFRKIFSSTASGFSVPYLILAIIGFLALVVAFSWKFKDHYSFLAKVWNACRGVWQGISSCMKMKSWWKFLLFSFSVWGCYWLMSACIIWAFHGVDPSMVPSSMTEAYQRISGLDMLDALFLMVAGAISSLVPVPGGFGAFHYVVSFALSSMYGIPMELGVIFATLSHESQVIMEIIAGGASWIRQSLLGHSSKNAA